MHWEKVPPWAKIITQLLLRSLRERDPYTYGHCLRVARNARLLAKAAGLSEEEQRIIEISGLFHDLGKIGIPDRILLKAGTTHPRRGGGYSGTPCQECRNPEASRQSPFLQSHDSWNSAPPRTYGRRRIPRPDPRKGHSALRSDHSHCRHLRCNHHDSLLSNTSSPRICLSGDQTILRPPIRPPPYPNFSKGSSKVG